MEKKKFELKLYHKIFIGLILGVIVGIIFSNMGGPDNPTIAKILEVCVFVGNLFLRLIKMGIVPLVFFSITSGVISLGDIKRLANTGVRTILLFLGTSAGAVTIGLIIANIIKPGSAMDLGSVAADSIEMKELPGFLDSVLDFFPENPIASMANGTMLHIISFSIFVGIALIMVGERAKPVTDFIEICSETMFKIIDIVVKFTPYGVFGLMANATAQFGVEIFGPILKFIIADYLSAITFTIVVLWVICLGLIVKVNPIKFFKKAFEPWLIAFSTCTSSAALPVAMKLSKDVGIPEENSSFVLPLGATMNMNGTCIYFGIIVVFASQLYGMDLSIATQIMLVFQATLLAVGCAAVPSIGLVISITLLESMGLPLEAIALVAGIYRIVDQIHTATNSHGDLIVAAVVSKLEGTFDYERFNTEKVDITKA
ncbi:dicarboxylate/amino acid:cation symporter [Sedimentibacter sp. MB31-C6]|uniref:dicarboxylate/amino acid:cation symporter n=1 Tax=Sedimentibacter sp. MB31-C6 TaxID=3109366 RepID=UPI002DDCDECD|nr:dicarboxylate/amino acid:cation symporter [Sedimentibacter sp. MB36-C1]WSI03836.1 dicarboxylate/amino acid:cation symporter [Sedimentibacter sp. MB36-C1]